MQLQHPLAERDGNIRDNEQLDMVGVEVWMCNVSAGACTHSGRTRELSGTTCCSHIKQQQHHIRHSPHDAFNAIRGTQSKRVKVLQQELHLHTVGLPLGVDITQLGVLVVTL